MRPVVSGRALAPDAQSRLATFQAAEARAAVAERALQVAQQRQSRALAEWQRFYDEVGLGRAAGHTGGMQDVLYGTGEPHARRGRARLTGPDGDGLSLRDKER